MAFSFDDKVCLLTGASGGIGEAIASQLAARGVSLVLTGRNAIKLSELVERLPGQHHIVAADIANPDELERVAALCRDKSVNMLINNAGVSGVGSFSDFTGAAINAVLMTNLVAPVLLTNRLLPVLKQADSAHVINVGSTFGSIGYAYHSLYCASKFGLRGWTESLMREYAGTHLHFHYIAPRATQTAINSSNANSLNKALGNAVDTPESVALALIDMLEKNQLRSFMGFPEKLFVKLNGAFPGTVDKALRKQLPTIEHYMTVSDEKRIS